MHIEPGIVDGAKLALSGATAVAAVGLGATMVAQALRRNGGLTPLVFRGGLATTLVFGFFQALPHFAVGVSEVHFILGSTLFLLLGAGPAAIGLALGLLLQGLLFAPTDLPQYAMNLTTLVVPLWAVSQLVRRIIPAGTRMADLTASQALKLSLTYQGGIVAWVAFWVIWGQGLGVETLTSLASFAASYAIVVAVEPLIDLTVLALVKTHARGPLFRPALTQT